MAWAAPGASALDWSTLTPTQQQGTVDAFYALAHPNAIPNLQVPYTNEGPVNIGSAELRNLLQMGASAPTDAATGAAEMGALDAQGLFVGAGNAAQDALPWAVELAPESGGTSLVLAGAVAVVGGLFADVTGGTPITPPPTVDGIDFEANVNRGSIAYPLVGCASLALSVGPTPTGSGFWQSGQPYGDTPPNSPPPSGCIRNQLPLPTLDAGGNVLPTYGAWLHTSAGWLADWVDIGDGTPTGSRCQLGAGPTVSSPLVLSSTANPGQCFGSTELSKAAIEPMSDYGTGPLTATPNEPVLKAPGGTANAQPVAEPPATPPTAAAQLAGLGAFIGSGATIPAPMRTAIESGISTPDVTVPDCAGNLWPEQASACDSLVRQAGLTPVDVAASDAACSCSYVQDANGVVEAITSDRQAQNWVSGTAVPPQSTVYVFVNDAHTSGGTWTAPDCAGQLVPSCESAFLSAGWTAAPTVTWLDGSATSTPIGYVVTQDPGRGAQVQTQPSSDPVRIGGAGAVIPAPLPNEVPSDYETRLEYQGFTTHTVHVLDPETLDPFQEANTVVTTNPAPGSVYDPAAAPSTPVELQVNPASMPATGPASGPGSGPGTGPAAVSQPYIPAGPIDPLGIDFPNFDLSPCNVFPFGIPCWMVHQVSALATTATPPSFTLTVPFVGPWTIDLGNVFGADTSSILDVWRPAMLFTITVGFLLWLAGLAMSGHTGGGGGESED